MNVESTSASSLMQLTKRQEQAHNVQNVFSDVLEAAGRRGYASAQDVEGTQPLEESIQTSWSDWFDVARTGRYETAENLDQLKQGFGEILSRAHSEGGYVQPKEFLNSLTKDELQVVQNIHWLAEPIQVDSLSSEGALNLLLPPAAQVDINHDGLTQSGAAYGIRFPDSNTPTDVTASWEEATAGMSMGDRMMYEFRMVAPILLANIHFDENGAYSHHTEPGDPDFVNPFAKPGYSYVQATQDQLDHLNFVKNWITPEQYDTQTDFWSRFQNLLTEKGAR